MDFHIYYNNISCKLLNKQKRKCFLSMNSLIIIINDELEKKIKFEYLFKNLDILLFKLILIGSRLVK